MRVLITGGLGFLGGRLAIHFSGAGHSIVLGSRKANAQPDWLPQADVIQIDWESRTDLERACEGIDVVIHAAGMNAQDCAANPVAALAFNGVATAKLVEAARRTGVRRFVYLSTAHVYGSPLVGTITEKTYPRNLHPYATSHLAGEYVLLDQLRRGDMDGSVIRMSNAVGYPVHAQTNCWNLLVPSLCREAVLRGSVTLKTSPIEERDFIPVSEACRIIERLISSKPGELGDVVNLGAGESLEIGQVVDIVREECRSMGMAPDLKILCPPERRSHPRLVYQSLTLLELGERVNPDIRDEVKKLVSLCKKWF